VRDEQDTSDLPVVFDDRFVAAAAHHEPSAQVRALRVERPDPTPHDRRRRQREDRRSSIRRTLIIVAVVGLVLAGLVWSLSGLGEAANADPRPSRVHAIYAVPADTNVDMKTVDAIRREIDVTQAWLRSETGGRTLRFDQRDGVNAVDINHLMITSTELKARPDAAALINDEFLTGGGEQPDELMLLFVPVEFSNLVRCGEGSRAGFAIIWVGSCGARPSATTTTFGEGTTFVIAHELIHALGAVQPCAPHYGNNGHVTDDPADLLYDGPAARRIPIRLDPGRDDYYATGNARCVDVSLHPAWQNARSN